MWFLDVRGRADAAAGCQSFSFRNTDWNAAPLKPKRESEPVTVKNVSRDLSGEGAGKPVMMVSKVSGVVVSTRYIGPIMAAKSES